MLFKKEHEKIYITRVNVETGRSLGYLPGDKDEKISPYLQGFKDNVYMMERKTHKSLVCGM